jgi:hypothetical protein
LLAIPIISWIGRCSEAVGAATGSRWIFGALSFGVTSRWSLFTSPWVPLLSCYFPRQERCGFTLGSMVLSVILLVTGVAVYGKVRRLAMSNEYRTLMESRRPLMNVIELKEWSYFPDESHPTEIRVSVVVHQSGRFAGNVTGEQTDSSGSSTTIFESTNDPRASVRCVAARLSRMHSR